MPSECLHSGILDATPCKTIPLMCKKEKLLLLSSTHVSLSTSSQCYTGSKMVFTGVPMGTSIWCITSLWRQNCSENKVPNFHYSCALSVGFPSIYLISFGSSCANPWPAHPPLAVINILVSTLFLFQILKAEQCKVTESKTLNKKILHQENQTAHCVCIFLSIDSLASRKETRCTHTEKKQAPSAWLGPLNFCWWGTW